jgi:hypothetical protein
MLASPSLSRLRVTVVAAAFTLCVLALTAGGLRAQGAGEAVERSGLVVTQLPASTRSLSLAGALPLASADPDLFLANAALAERGRGMGVSWHRYSPDATFLSFAGGTAWWRGGVGLAVRHAEYPGPAEGIIALPRRPGDRMRRRAMGPNGPPPASETAVSVGYGRVLKGFRVGAAVSALQLRVGNRSDRTALLDLGLARDVSRFTLGLSGGGLGPTVDLTPGFERMPWWVTAAAGSRAAPLGPADISAVASLTARTGGQLDPAVGVEVGWWPIQGRTFVGRLGVGGPEMTDAARVSLGAGFLGDSFTLEYGWRAVSGGSDLHGVSLRFR